MADVQVLQTVLPVQTVPDADTVLQEEPAVFAEVAHPEEAFIREVLEKPQLKRKAQIHENQQEIPNMDFIPVLLWAKRKLRSIIIIAIAVYLKTISFMSSEIPLISEKDLVKIIP